MPELLHAVAPDVARVVRAILGEHMDLDDVVQESLINLAHALPSFRGESRLGRFANRIAVRTALRARRRGRARQAREWQAQTEAPSRSEATPDDALRAMRRHALLHRLLEDLPEVQAETLALRIVLGLSLTETADATGVPLNTVRSRVRLAREALRTRIENEPELHELLEWQP